MIKYIPYIGYIGQYTWQVYRYIHGMYIGIYMSSLIEAKSIMSLISCIYGYIIHHLKGHLMLLHYIYIMVNSMLLTSYSDGSTNTIHIILNTAHLTAHLTELQRKYSSEIQLTSPARHSGWLHSRSGTTKERKSTTLAQIEYHFIT